MEVEITTISESVELTDTKTLQIQCEPKPVYIVDGLNVLKNRNDGRPFENLSDLKAAILLYLLPMLACLSHGIIHLILKPFAIEGVDAIRFGMACLSVFSARGFGTTSIYLHQIMNARDDKEADDRFLFRLQCSLKSYQEPVIISNDKFRSLWEHADRPIYHISGKVIFEDPMNGTDESIDYLKNLAKTVILPTQMQITEGFSEEVVYDISVSAGSYPIKKFDIRDNCISVYA